MRIAYVLLKHLQASLFPVLALSVFLMACPMPTGDDPGEPLETPPAAPAAPSLTAGDTQIAVTWAAVENALAYEVWYGAASDPASAVKFGGDVTGTSAAITGLANGTTYHVRVKAKNAAGTSGFSPSASAAPVAATTAPAAPAAPSLTAGDTQIAVAWTGVASVSAYEVWYGTADDSASAGKFGDDVGGTSATITGLTNGTTYYVWIRARNSAGESGFSPSASAAPVAATTPPAAPAAPSLTAGNAQIAVTWAVVANASAYEVWYGTANNSASAWKFGDDVGGTSATITGLTNGTTYYVWIRAGNSAGKGGFSPSASAAPVAATTSPAAPAAPSLTAGDTQIAVAWIAVASASVYEVWYGTADNSASALQSGGDVTGTLATITGLANGTTYYVWIRARNSAGESGFSPSASAVPVAATTSPAAPAAPSLTAGNAQIAVTWAVVANASAYEVWYGTANNSASAGKFGDDISGTSATITGLANGTTYHVWIKAKNSGGTSDFSPSASAAPVAATTSPAAPAAPSLTAGNAQIAVTWTTVASASAYEVWYGTANNSASALQSGGDVTGTSATITGLSNGTTYHVWIKAKNSGGISGFSPSALAGPWTSADLTALTGVWDSFFDGYVISASALEYDDGGASAAFGFPSMNFSGGIKFVSAYGANAGVIVIEYTDAPDAPYATGTSNYEGIYYQKIDANTVKFANAYDTGGTDILTLAAALEKFSQANESALVSWGVVSAQFRQPSPVVNMGAFRGTWKGDDTDDMTGAGMDEYAGTTWMRITDSKLSVFWEATGAGEPVYRGNIVEVTDITQNTGRIYIQFPSDADGGTVGEEDDYYVLAWTKAGGDYTFSVYNDDEDVVSADLNDLKALDDSHFVETEEGIISLGWSNVTFTKQ